MKPGVWPLKIFISCIDKLENGEEREKNLISMEKLARLEAGPSSWVLCVTSKFSNVLFMKQSLSIMRVTDTRLNVDLPSWPEPKCKMCLLPVVPQWKYSWSISNGAKAMGSPGSTIWGCLIRDKRDGAGRESLCLLTGACQPPGSAPCPHQVSSSSYTGLSLPCLLPRQSTLQGSFKDFLVLHLQRLCHHCAFTSLSWMS